MPVEIRELIIRATVINDQEDGAATTNQSGNESVVAACVEQVLRILERQKER